MSDENQDERVLRNCWTCGWDQRNPDGRHTCTAESTDELAAWAKGLYWSPRGLPEDFADNCPGWTPKGATVIKRGLDDELDSAMATVRQLTAEVGALTVERDELKQRVSTLTNQRHNAVTACPRNSEERDNVRKALRDLTLAGVDLVKSNTRLRRRLMVSAAIHAVTFAAVALLLAGGEA